MSRPGAVTASTRLAAVIGDPVRHSLSPTIHNAAFEACGIDGVYVALPVKASEAGEAVEAMRRFGWFGLSVTMPHKHDIVMACDELTAAAAELGAVNCVFWRDDRIVGDNTDGDGFVRGLAADLAADPADMSCVVLGAGGAAKAVVRSLAAHGATSVGVINRNADRAAVAAELAGPAGRVATVADLGAADLIVNATPIGMADTADADGQPIRCRNGGQDRAIVADLIYHPAETALIAAARARGLRAQNGLPMLVHQAAIAFELWTGVPAPVDTMTAAVISTLT